MHRCIVPVVVVLLAAHVIAQSRDATGILAGCITDPVGYPLPGVTINVSAEGVHRTIFSDAADSSTAGCYELTDLPRGSYIVFAR
jgi:hypothetical protein